MARAGHAAMLFPGSEPVTTEGGESQVHRACPPPDPEPVTTEGGESQVHRACPPPGTEPVTTEGGESQVHRACPPSSRLESTSTAVLPARTPASPEAGSLHPNQGSARGRGHASLLTSNRHGHSFTPGLGRPEASGPGGGAQPRGDLHWTEPLVQAGGVCAWHTIRCAAPSDRWSTRGTHPQGCTSTMDLQVCLLCAPSVAPTGCAAPSDRWSVRVPPHGDCSLRRPTFFPYS